MMRSFNVRKVTIIENEKVDGSFDAEKIENDR